MKSIAFILAAMLLLAGTAQAGTFGAELSYSGYLSSNYPATYFDIYGRKQNYKAEVLLHGSWHHVLFEIAPTIEGGNQTPWGDPPTQGGMKVGVGLDLGPVIVSVYHWSAHNLDNYSPYSDESAIDVNAVRFEWRIGDKRDFSLWGD